MAILDIITNVPFVSRTSVILDNDYKIQQTVFFKYALRNRSVHRVKNFFEREPMQIR